MNATRPWCLSLALALTFASPAPAEVQFRTEIGFPVFGPPFGISDVTADFVGDVYIGLPNNPSNNIHKFDPFGQDLGGFATGPAGVVGLTPDASGLIYASHGNRIAQYLNSGQPLEPNFVTSDVLGQGKLATDKFGNFYVSPPRSSPGARSRTGS
jgi:hypothetical protein